jgi:8-oxo-dGTP pyrophosphatase MutT (NUDIX family)
VSFPGGAYEPCDATIIDTALRETEEEIGIRKQDVRILGSLDPFPTITNYLVTPVIGVIKWPYPFRLAETEVARIFSIPVTWLCNPQNFEERWMQLRDGREGNVIFYRDYDGETVWGITGGITVNLMRVLKLLQ